ncbi:Glucokinase [Candidatus Methylobacter favarea]|uniref:Glucokinase n=1 Tax=Candidatus Methylobacter favarea TaxID=2707345 RepID=A0A8S0X877_9GAMM|nr:glucokinase [Candidatus Methylobacter favarea]CAA9890820.1 Glucokinase [Candidatus Methylobacter favarea]
MILAGDIGGTKTVLSLWDKGVDGSFICTREHSFASREYKEFDEILAIFLPSGASLDSACFGVAGPVVKQRVQTTNLPWFLDSEELKIKLGIADKVKLLNDLEAMALGMLYLSEKDLVELNTNAEIQPGNIAVIAAGTGLGEAILYWDGAKHHLMATEGGHCDFAAQNADQDLLVAYLRKKYSDHISYERILSGDGLGHLYDFLCAHKFAPACLAVPSVNSDIDRNAVISRLGISGEDPLCAEAVRIFVEIYGAEAGNLALKALAIGGVFIGGGIAPKILPAMADGKFMQVFKAKGRLLPLLDKVPVKLCLNPRTPLIGAINYFNL